MIKSPYLFVVTIHCISTYMPHLLKCHTLVYFFSPHNQARTSMRTMANNRRSKRRSAGRLLRTIRTMIREEGVGRFLCSARQEGGTIFLDFTNMNAGGGQTFSHHADSFAWLICEQSGLVRKRHATSENSVTFVLRRE